jgi:hypothetical protein
MAEFSELMAFGRVFSGWFNVGCFAGVGGRRLHRFWVEQNRFGTFSQPLL